MAPGEASAVESPWDGAATRRPLGASRHPSPLMETVKAHGTRQSPEGPQVIDAINSLRTLSSSAELQELQESISSAAWTQSMPGQEWTSMASTWTPSQTRSSQTSLASTAAPGRRRRPSQTSQKAYGSYTEVRKSCIQKLTSFPWTIHRGIRILMHPAFRYESSL